MNEYDRWEILLPSGDLGWVAAKAEAANNKVIRSVYTNVIAIFTMKIKKSGNVM